MLQMVIANRLTDGLVVFLAGDESWTTAIADGATFDTEQGAARALETGKRHELECRIVDPNLIEVALENGRPVPTAIRERIRAFGPTIETKVSGHEHAAAHAPRAERA